MDYLKINGKRYNLTADEMVCDGQKLSLYFPGDDLTINDIKNELSGQDEFIVYGCVTNVNEENEVIETDEYVATTFEGFTRIVAINYDNERDIYEVIFVHPIDIDTRMSDMESAMNFLLMGGDM